MSDSNDTPTPADALPNLTDALLTPQEQRLLNLIQTIEGLSRTVVSKINSPLFLDAVAGRILHSDYLRESLEQMVDAAVRRHLNPTSTAKVLTPVGEYVERSEPPAGSVKAGLKAYLHPEDPQREMAIKVSRTPPDHPLYPLSFDAYFQLSDGAGNKQWVEGRSQLVPEAIKAIEEALEKTQLHYGEYVYAIVATIYVPDQNIVDPRATSPAAPNTP